MSLWAMVKFCMCPSFPFGIEGGMWGAIVLIPDQCLSIYFTMGKIEKWHLLPSHCRYFDKTFIEMFLE